MKAVIFGAGNIGRGFLALQLAKSGFEITFIDIDTDKVTSLNRERQYPVFVVSEKGTNTEVVQSVSGILSKDTEAIEKAIVEADIILTAVGKNALQLAAHSLACGLRKRLAVRPKSEMHIAVVACENIQDNTEFLRTLIEKELLMEELSRVMEVVSFPNCVVDRIVPNYIPRNRDEFLAVTVEEYFQLTIDGQGLRGPLPKIAGANISMYLNASLEQKLCTLNMAHAIVGYYGYLRGYQYIHEAVLDKEISTLLQGALAEVSATITLRHEHITDLEQSTYTEKVVARFKNQNIHDEVTRVARQPIRKLGPNDRLVKPTLLSLEQGVIPVFLATGITAALHYNSSNDEEAQELCLSIKETGIDQVLQRFCGLEPKSNLGKIIKASFLLRAL